MKRPLVAGRLKESYISTLRQNIYHINAFLYKQLVLNFGPDRLAKLENINREAIRNMMSTLPFEKEGDATRGYDNVVISTTDTDDLATMEHIQNPESAIDGGDSADPR